MRVLALHMSGRKQQPTTSTHSNFDVQTTMLQPTLVTAAVLAASWGHLSSSSAAWAGNIKLGLKRASS